MDSDIKIDICSSAIEQSFVQNVVATPNIIGVTLDLEAVVSSSLGTFTDEHPIQISEKSFEENCSISNNNNNNKQNRDVVFIVDKSGSMHDVIRQVASTIDRLAASLTDSDRLCVITFSSGAHTEVPLQKIADCRQQVADCVNSLAVDGSTNMIAALELAVDVIASEHETQKGTT